MASTADASHRAVKSSQVKHIKRTTLLANSYAKYEVCSLSRSADISWGELSLVMTGCPLSGRGQGHVSNFYILDLENFATASHRRIGAINKLNKLVDGQLVDCTYDGRARHG